ncbi:helix-turn-helix domain-containing protein [Paenibacillus sp. YPG26]|uniref:MarR family winged helix-turn-helix transcriptional regulator n=1 Tax=Paenibacillus sp. YPG26 TaxID=2878915 RepID=UPI00203ADDDC|nr:helix-turn-helix domain-containing protein [Paenibacillus sp. YPG26]USB31652.1 MarR family winged helix-turn-helix transcriptional regulator [Paenibacillus sp. YPG26]
MLSEHQKIVKELHEAFNEYYMHYNKGAKKLDQYNLTVQQENMLLFVMRNQRTTVNEIAAHFSITKGAVSQVLSHLESREFIRRESNPSDRRESFILLGREGENYAHLIEEADKAFVEKYFSQVKKEDLEQMLRTINNLNQAISDQS